MSHFFFFDFDSTICSKESLDELLFYCLKQQNKYSDEIKQTIENITDSGMNGNVSLQQTIEKRLALVSCYQKDIHHIAQAMVNQLTQGIEQSIKQLIDAKNHVIILSGGFKELIIPSAIQLGIDESNILANQFIYSNDKVIGLDANNRACQPNSKSFWIKQYSINKEEGSKTIMIGDGANDLETQDSVDYFIGFGANICREKVRKNSPFFASSVNELNNIIDNILENTVS